MGNPRVSYTPYNSIVWYGIGDVSMNKYIWCALGITACIWLVGLRDTIVLSILIVACEEMYSQWRK